MMSGETHQDKIAEQDEDYMKAKNSAVAWAHSQMDDGPEDIHARRFQSVMDGEKRALEERRDR